MRIRGALLAAGIVLAACGPTRGGAGGRPKLAASSPRLSPPQPIDPHARGAAYLAALGNQIQPRWGQFLEDCRLRLPADHPLNAPALVASVELVIGEDGRFVEQRLINGSGNGDFDRVIMEVLREVVAGKPPEELESDDGRVHLKWLFARDRRQAGPATAEVIVIELPLVATVQRLLDRGELERATTRLAAAPAADRERLAATELVMIAALREGLASSDGTTREAALDAVAHTKIAALAPDVQRLVAASGQIEQRVKAIEAAAALGDPAVVPVLVDGLTTDFDERPEVALAKVAALVALGRSEDAARAIHAVLGTGGGSGDGKRGDGTRDGKRGDGTRDTTDHKRAIAAAVSALAIVPEPKLARELGAWFTRGDAEVRQSVCQALPAAVIDGAAVDGAAVGRASELIGRGLRDPEASVRAACASAAARRGMRADRATIRRLVELVRDRDEVVRARAVAALGVLDRTARPRAALDDRASPVRAAAAIGAADAELRTLVKDKDPDVRAAALAALAERAADLALAAARDPASQVRRAAVAGITDDALLEKLAGDADPEVATAALVRHAARRGRAAITTSLLERLLAATPKSLERVRIARAWLLAP